MKGVLLVLAAIVAFATGQDCPAYYVRSQSGQSCYRYFNMRVPYGMASEFCEMVTPCGNGPAKMGSLASVGSALENMEIYQMVAAFSQDNQMENEIWLGWNTMNPFFWEDGTPAYPNGFSAFGSTAMAPPRPGAGGGPSRGWPVNPQNPLAPAPGSAPIMKRQAPPTRPGQGGQQIPAGVGPQWDLLAVTEMRAFVCEVPAGVNIPPGQGPGMNNPGFGGQQPGMGGQQPGMGGQQPGMGPQQPGMGPQQPGMGPQQPGMGPQQPGMGPQQPGMGPQQPGAGGPQQPGVGNPNPRFNRPRMLQHTDVFA